MNRHFLIFLDKSIFQIIFYFILLLAKLRKRNKPDYYPQLKGTEGFLVIRPGGLGDAIMSIPLLKALRKRFPQSRISLLCVKKNKGALQHLPYFDQLVVIDSLCRLHKNLSIVLRGQYDVVIDLEPFRKISSIVAYLFGTNIRIGFDTNNRRLLYTHYVTYANEKCYESLNMLRQLSVLGLKVSDKEAVDMSFPLPDDLLENTRSMLRSYGLKPDEDFVIALAPGVLKAHHRWSMEKFSSVIRLIQQEDDSAKILLVGAPTDIADAQEVLEHLRNRKPVINLVGKTSFVEVLAILKNCRILIACDGGIVYVGAAMGCGTISIWGPGVMDRFKPPGKNHLGVRKDYFCVPCVNYSRFGEFPGCPYDRKCINDISALDVFEKYVALKTRILDKGNEGPSREGM